MLANGLVLLALFALSGCAQLFFYPEKDYVLTPQELRVRYQDVYTDVRDGTRLHGWLLHAHGKSLARVLFLHGNAQNIGTHLASVYWLTEEGFDVFLLDYRGYGGSQGRPSLDGIHADAEAALQYLVEEMDTDSEGLIVFGQSLGGTVAIHTAALAGGIAALEKDCCQHKLAYTAPSLDIMMARKL